MGCSVRVGISTGIIYLLTPACVGTPAGIDQMQGLVTPSVTELVAPLLAVWRHLHLMEIHLHRVVVEFTCSDQWGMVVLMCDHWPLELALNGHWYGLHL